MDEDHEEPYEMNVQHIIKQIDQHDWQDIDKSPLSEIPHNQFIQTIPSAKYLIYYKRFRGVLNAQEQSPRSFILTKLMLRLKSTNYYALMLRSKYFFSQQNDSASIQQQIFFANCIININHKQYQIWTYKKQLFKVYEHLLINRQDIYHTESQFIDYLLDQDTKNYHVWDYKLWITQFYRKHKQELQSSKNILFKQTNKEIKSQLQAMNFNVSEINWKNCYSLWSYRYNLRLLVAKQSSPQQIVLQEKQELSLLKKWFQEQLNQMNECGWNYLTGFILQASISSEQLIKEMVQFSLKLFFKNAKNRFAGNTIIQFYDALQQKYGFKSQQKAQILHMLLKSDPVREKYYKYLLGI